MTENRRQQGVWDPGTHPEDAPQPVLENEPYRQPPPKMARPYLKLACAGFSFFYAGTNDGTIGPLLPYILRRYNISTGLVTVTYGATFIGWVLSALTNTHLTTTLRLRLGATLSLGAILQLVAQLLRFWNPPFPLFAITFLLTALGQAYQDSYSNTFVASLPVAHRWLGFIHAMYMLGCLTGPLIATPVASHTKWYLTYAVEAGLGAINLVFVLIAFELEEAVVSPQTEDNVNAATNYTTRARNKQAFQEIKQALRLRTVWLLSMFYFFYLGAVITVSGWVVEYLVQERSGSLSSMGYVPAALSGGGFLGRLLLAEPTHRFGERRMILLYIVICLALQLMFWLIPNLISGVVVYVALGFFSGPFFATGISVASKLCPKSIQHTALGFIFVLAQAGGSLFPTMTGVIAAKAGVKVLQPILVGLFVATGVSWCLVPRTAGKVREV
ncbi:uncharacterized protein A1O9_00174 [Exophiala aquamarina CBS 119918]|uniref:Major facilitator superfamily (MFS) profile domain-containing protein n=1 Tax=Exophiala aquamarina CBS 119918 TaxID=1182545 RepID=A0A072PR24_9EURO|nr:uncharacterized protein A1O9_00174 [Exophiala aquamarina CBS 119918]KEF62202.1 hypothetical protein A1O9_00174 [Exophiala aquamarina CBS 119918]